MKEYKVVKEFGSAKKGDSLEYNEASGLYTFDIAEKGNSRYMSMDEDAADMFVKDGYLIPINLDNDEEMCESCSTLLKLDQFVDDAIAQYEQDNEDMLEAYSTGSVPTCVKVEAETVYHNMTVMLNKIKEIIHG